MKPFIKAFKAGITLDSMRRNDTVTSKNVSFFQFWGHNVPINCSKHLGVRKEFSHARPWVIPMIVVDSSESTTVT